MVFEEYRYVIHHFYDKEQTVVNGLIRTAMITISVATLVPLCDRKLF